MIYIYVSLLILKNLLMIYVHRPGSIEYKKLQNKAMSLGASKFGVSTKGQYKYFVVYKGKTIHFGHRFMSDWTHHKDEARRDNYRTRHKAILKKDGTPAYTVEGTPAYFSWHLLW